MNLKDYYTILELAPSASVDEIRKSYRRLAQLYHPDKSGDDQYALAKFTDIKEAYETLTNPVSKAHYLQQRWYAKSIGKPMSGFTLTPESLLQKVLELDRYVRTLDVHRMDEQGLVDYLLELFSQDNIEKINSFNERIMVKEIIQANTRTLQSLSYPVVVKIIPQLKKLKPTDDTNSMELDRIIRQKKINYIWEKRRTSLVLAMVLLICLMIFFVTRK